jgi:hypothetical protein
VSVPQRETRRRRMSYRGLSISARLQYQSLPLVMELTMNSAAIAVGCVALEWLRMAMRGGAAAVLLSVGFVLTPSAALAAAGACTLLGTEEIGQIVGGNVRRPRPTSAEEGR